MRDPDVIWRPLGKPFSVHLAPPVLAELSDHVDRAPASGYRAPERGGLLLGRARQVDDEWYVAIERLVPLEIEHARGESWTLSPRDRNSLTRTISNLTRGRHQDLSVVGWYRTHTRPGIFLDQYDFDLFRDHFGHESSIALVVSPRDKQAGIFFWEAGDIRRSSPYQVFDLPRIATTSGSLPSGAQNSPSSRIAQWAFAIPVIAGIALGVFWNPAPLDRKPGNVASLRRLPEGESSEERPIFHPPPLPAESAQPYVPPAEPEADTARSRTTDTPVAKPVKSLILPAVKRSLPEPQISDAPPFVPASVRSDATLHTPVPHPAVEAQIEPARPSAVRRVVGAIPGLGFLRKKKESTERDNFVPARIVKQVEPKLTGPLAQPVTVRFRIMLTDDGAIQRAELLTRKVDSVAADRAFDALKRWRFQPAQRNNRPVASEMEVQFRFGSGAVAERRMSDPGGGGSE